MYNCKCRCENFREHVGNGPYVSAAATPTRSNVEARKNLETEKRWTKENEAFVRLHKQGYDLPHLNGADVIEKHATHEIELKHGKLYDKKIAGHMEKIEMEK